MTDFQLDAKELTKDVPFVLKGLAKSLIDWVNNLDENHDGKKDIAQLAPIIIKALPIIETLLPYIHLPDFIKWIVSHDWVMDKTGAAAALNTLAEVAKEAGALANKK
jgi:hypothetical protein